MNFTRRRARMDQEDIKIAADVVKAGLPLFERIVQTGKKAYDIIAKTQDPSDKNGHPFEEIEKDLKNLISSQKKVAHTVDSLLRYLRTASKLRIECDKCFELAFNSMANPSDIFWSNQRLMVSNWEEWNSELVGAIERGRVPLISNDMAKNLQENSRHFRNEYTKIVSLLDSTDPNLGDYRIHLREARKSSLNIEKEFLIHVEDLIKDLGFGEI